MAKYEFHFVVTGIELPYHVQENVSRVIAEAGALALGEHNPPTAVNFPVGPNIWWRGRPSVDVMEAVGRIVLGSQGGPNPTGGCRVQKGEHDALI